MKLEVDPPDPQLPHYRTIKTSLSSILKRPETLPKITAAVCTVDKIVSRAMMFLKMYLIHSSDNPPVINDAFIDAIFKTVCKETSQGRPESDKMKKIRAPLKKFYKEHFVPPLPAGDKEISYTYLNTVLDYAATQIVTVFENNVKAHYVEYVESYVNTVWHKYDLTERIRRIKKTKKDRKAAIRKLNGTLRNIKTDLLNVGSEPFKSHSSYHAWIRAQKAIVLPRKTKYEKDLLYYDIQCNPQDYYPAMLRITDHVERAGRKPRSFCPLRTSFVPKYIRIDTTTLVHLLYENDMGLGKKSALLTGGALKRNQPQIWVLFFRTAKKIFGDTTPGRHPNYVFDHMINTDGVSVSILMIRRDRVGRRAPNRKPVADKERYIDDLSEEECETLRSKSVVGIDPNMSDLLFCTNEDASKRFRYTQNQQRQESRSKAYQEIRSREKKRTHNKVDDRTIEEWESDLSAHNYRTVNLDGFKAYVTAKLLVTSKVETFYQQHIFRKLKLSGYWNTRRSEQWMINGFKKTFGDPGEVVVGIGDWEQKKHRKFKEPVKGKGFRNLLRKGGCQVLLVDEFRTSCKCSHCQHEEGKCETFRVRKDPNTRKPEEKRQLRKVHGLLICSKCSRLWNRDVNSAINTVRLTRERLEGRDRPQYMSRQTSGQSPNRGVTSTGGEPNRPTESISVSS